MPAARSTRPRRLCIATALLLTLAGCGSPLEALNAITPDGGYERQADIAFGTSARQRLDVYRATRPAADRHTVVFVYGGAWRSGKRRDYAFVAGALAEAGHDVIVPDYRLYPAVTWPAFIEDVAAAIAHVNDNARALLGRELETVVMMGHSSGAHSAAIIASAPQRWLGDIDVDVTGLVGIAGPYDLPLDDPEVAPVFAGIQDSSAAIPVEHVSAVHPATLLLHGSDDERVLPRHTRRYAEALRSAGVAVEVESLDGTGHAGSIASFAAPLSMLNDACQHTLAWLDRLPAASGAPDTADRAGGDARRELAD